MNLDELGGISKSLFIWEAKMPSAKKRSAGFVRLSISKFISMFFEKDAKIKIL
jgi:hypothetical protein